MLTFRTKLLNLFVENSDKTWIKSSEIETASIDFGVKRVIGRPDAMVAVDLSVCDDFSAVSYTLYSETQRAFHVHTEFYFPEGALPEHPNRELYRKWVAGGHLKLCKGPVIDYQMIVNDILENNKYLKIIGIGYDPYRSMDFVNMISAAGAKNVLQPVRQNYASFTSPVETFEHAMKMGKVSFTKNPIICYCFGNAVLDEDRNENKKPIKRSSMEKIDGAVTTIMTFYLFNNVKR